MDFIKIINLIKETKKIINVEDLRRDVHMKGSADFVTATDIAVSSFLKEKLFLVDSSIGFYSEEECGELSSRSWILDPIDGTTNYVYGYNMSSVSLALYEDGEIKFGVVYNPFSEECYTAQKGNGAFLNGTKITVSDRTLKDSLIEFGAGSTRKHEADKSFEIGKEIFKRCVDVRRVCSSALDFCFIAAGRIDGYFESKLKPWDYAAGSLILKEAGGISTNYNGEALSMENPSSVIASNGVIHKELSDIILKTL